MSWVTNNEWLQAKDHEEVNWPEMGRFLHWYRTDSYLLVAVGCVSILGSLTFLFVPKIFYLIDSIKKSLWIPHCLPAGIGECS
jgi:hypothetical protein